MAESSNNIALAVAIQSAAGTFTTPSQPADLMPISNCRLQIDGITITNDEYTGSPVKNGDDIIGKRASISYNVKLRAPGGSTPPAANAFLLGRILQSCKMTEIRSATAIPVAAEALGSGSTTTMAKLGAGAAATADLYKTLPLILSDNGSGYKRQITAIRSYSASKEATLVEQLSAPPAANYQIPKYLGYVRSITAADPVMLSKQLWMGGNRYDLMDANVTSAQIVVPTSTKQQGAYPELQVTYDVTINATAAENSPAVTPLGAVPFFKDGDGILANKAIGLQTFTIDLGIQSDNPPNPNQPDGSDPAQIVSSTAKLSMTKQMYRKNVFDGIALADAQAQHAFYAAWGSAAGNFIQIVVPDARFNYPNPDVGGPFVMETQDMMIDAFDRGVAILFPY